jgi:hypothetical protein
MIVIAIYNAEGYYRLADGSFAVQADNVKAAADMVRLEFPEIVREARDAGYTEFRVEASAEKRGNVIRIEF